MKYIKTYAELKEMFGRDFTMPPEEYMGKEIVYRCPYFSRCPTGKRCFIVTAAKPFCRDEILNVKCQLYGGMKIPVYVNDVEKM